MEVISKKLFRLQHLEYIPYKKVVNKKNIPGKPKKPATKINRL